MTLDLSGISTVNAFKLPTCGTPSVTGVLCTDGTNYFGFVNGLSLGVAFSNAVSLNTIPKSLSSGIAEYGPSGLSDDGTKVTSTETVQTTGTLDGREPVNLNTVAAVNVGSTYSHGYYFNQNATAGQGVTYTLPSTQGGKRYCIKNSGTTGVVNTGRLTVYPAASSYVILNGVVNTVGGGGTHGVISGGAAGDEACFTAVDGTHWDVTVIQGTWTEN